MLKEFLKEFKFLEKNNPGPIEDSIHFDFKKHNGHAVVSVLIHGNEVGSLPGTIKIIHAIKNNRIPFLGSVTFILGNKKSATLGKRYLDFDLNRSFSDDLPIKNSHEIMRAVEIKKVLNSASVYLDIHQTNLKCQAPFYIFEADYNSYLWARAIGIAQIFITRKNGKRYSNTGLCTDEYVRKQNKPAITLELGQAGFNKQADDNTYHAIKNLLNILDLVFLKKRSIKNIASKKNDFFILERIHRQVFLSPKMKLENNFYNLQRVFKNQKLGEHADGKAFYSPKDGYILFPQYPARNELGFPIEPLDPFIYSLTSEIKKNHRLLFIR